MLLLDKDLQWGVLLALQRMTLEFLFLVNTLFFGNGATQKTHVMFPHSILTSWGAVERLHKSSDKNSWRKSLENWDLVRIMPAIEAFYLFPFLQNKKVKSKANFPTSGHDIEEMCKMEGITIWVLGKTKAQ